MREELVEIVELLVHLGHWARIDVSHVCEPEEYVLHEVIFLRALARFGEGTTGTKLAQRLGWTKGRVSQVGEALERKGHITRGRVIAVTNMGLYEGAGAAFVFRAVGERMLASVDERDRETLLGFLRTMRNEVGLLSRDREDPSLL